MNSVLFFDVVVSEGSLINQLFTSEDESLLLGWDTFLVLDFSFKVINFISGVNVHDHGFSSKGSDEDLEGSALHSQEHVNCGLFRDVTILESGSVLQLFSSKDKSLLRNWDSSLVLHVFLNGLDLVGWVDVNSPGLSSDGFDEDLHIASTSESQDQVDGVLISDVVVPQGSGVLQLFSTEDQSLVLLSDSLSLVKLSFQVLNSSSVNVHVHS